jgi:sodium-dependent dicarboxylate transporter 2/3/5
LYNRVGGSLEELEFEESGIGTLRGKIGLILGPLLFIFILLSPISFPNGEAKRVFAIFLWIIVWWICEPIPLSATALLGPILASIFQVMEIREIFSPFADSIIFLFMGSFFIAKGLQVSGVDKRISRVFLSNRTLSRNPFLLFLSMSLLCSFLSMWLSNSAVTAIFYPIALAVLKPFPPAIRKKLSPALLLMIAYSASLGGIGTPVGTPPNLIGIAMLEKFANIKLSFFEWMIFAFPLYILGFIIFAFYLKISIKFPNVMEVDSSNDSNQPFTKDQVRAILIFCLTVVLWIFPGIVFFITSNPHTKKIVSTTFNESVVAMFGGILFFLIPSGSNSKRTLLSWKDTETIDWGTLILFGGGLSMGNLIFKTGLAKFFGENFLNLFGKPSPMLFTFLSIVVSVALTEFVSNTAAANIVIPIIISIASSANVPILPPVLGATIACSLAFMLPVSTPPNAIVYGSKMITIPEMIRRGITLDVIMIFLIFAFLVAFKM